MGTDQRGDEDADKGRRKAAPARAPKARKEDGKKSLNLRIDEDSYQRLNVHALYTGKTVSQLVMEYAQTLRDFVVHRRGGAGPARSPAEDAA